MRPLTALVRAARKITRRHVPAAWDNSPGRDIAALRNCRSIDRLPLGDTESSARATDYLRHKEGDQP